MRRADGSRHIEDRQDKSRRSLPHRSVPEPALKQSHARPENHYRHPSSALPVHLSDKRSENDHTLGQLAWRSKHLPRSSHEPDVHNAGNDFKQPLPGNRFTSESHKPSSSDDFRRNYDRNYPYEATHRHGISRDFSSFNAPQRAPDLTYTEAKTFNEYLRNERRDEKSNKTYLKLFNLENNYEENDKEDFAGGFQDSSDIPKSKLELEYDTKRDEANKLFEVGADNPPVHQGAACTIPTSLINANSAKDVVATQSPSLDDQSADSIKTYRTSSTLKEMMTRTDNLQKKFQDLEDQLANINEGESVDRLTDKIRTYNSYYSDWNPESNESDHI